MKITDQEVCLTRVVGESFLEERRLKLSPRRWQDSRVRNVQDKTVSQRNETLIRTFWYRVPSYEVQKQTKLIYSKRNHRSSLVTG